MKIRKKLYGESNMIGKNVESLRKSRGIKQKDFIARMQAEGCDINPTSYSKLEGQLRMATDRELFVIARILEVPMEALFDSDYRR
ncbi:MAG: helix-turn-helix transcriptional regulator [Clostridia bacterium]|nr:helix-turn-helix transcriptional regulator [Clostridia bacterium]